MHLTNVGCSMGSYTNWLGMEKMSIYRPTCGASTKLYVEALGKAAESIDKTFSVSFHVRGRSISKQTILHFGKTGDSTQISLFLDNYKLGVA